MSKFKLYNVPLKDITDTKQVFEYDLNDDYFKKIDSPEVQSGNVKAVVTVVKKVSNYELLITLNGFVNIPCNRCLDNMQQPIQYKDVLLVKFGERFSEEGEIVIVPESEGCINLAWFLYEFIVVNIPIKHVHASGECNKQMTSKLRRHTVRTTDERDEDYEDDDFENNEIEDIKTDPRWDGLQNILD